MKFVLDTNVFVDAFRDETFAEALAAFVEQALPTTFLSAVVVQEVAASTGCTPEGPSMLISTSFEDRPGASVWRFR